MKALLRLYSGSIQALLRLHYGALYLAEASLERVPEGSSLRLY